MDEHGKTQALEHVCEHDPLASAPVVVEETFALLAKEPPKKHHRHWGLPVNLNVGMHLLVAFAALLWLGTGVDLFLIVTACLLATVLCCVPQVLWCRLVDWIALALVLLVLVYRDHTAIFEDVMLVVFRVHTNTTAAR